MTCLKFVLVLLVLLQIVWAQDVSPFTWKALEEAEKHASTAAASSYAESAPPTERERVFAVEISAEPTGGQGPGQDLQPTIPGRAYLNVTFRLFCLLAIPAAFLSGWVGRSKQVASSQALQQATNADKAADVQEAMEQKLAELECSAQVTCPCLACVSIKCVTFGKF